MFALFAAASKPRMHRLNDRSSPAPRSPISIDSTHFKNCLVASTCGLLLQNPNLLYQTPSVPKNDSRESDGCGGSPLPKYAGVQVDDVARLGQLSFLTKTLED